MHEGRAAPTRAEVNKHLAARYQVTDEKRIVTFGFKNGAGGGRTTGFALIYNSLEEMKKMTPAYVLIRNKVIPAPAASKSRKTLKERKNKMKKKRGAAKAELRK